MGILPENLVGHGVGKMLPITFDRHRGFVTFVDLKQDGTIEIYDFESLIMHRFSFQQTGWSSRISMYSALQFGTMVLGAPPFDKIAVEIVETVCHIPSSQLMRVQWTTVATCLAGAFPQTSERAARQLLCGVHGVRF